VRDNQQHRFPPAFQSLAREAGIRAHRSLPDAWLEASGLRSLDSGPFHFWFGLVALGNRSGACEWWAGVRRTAFAFWSVHLGTGIIEAIVGLAASRLVNSRSARGTREATERGAFGRIPRLSRRRVDYFFQRFQVYVACVVGAVLAGRSGGRPFHARTDPEGLNRRSHSCHGSASRLVARSEMAAVAVRTPAEA